MISDLNEAVDKNDYVPLFLQIRNVLRRRIETNEYVPGDRLVEREIALELDVSRVPVREALRALESEGYVAVLPRRGAVVRELTRQDVDDLFDIRMALEVHAARRAAERRDEDGLDILRKTLEATAARLEAGDLTAVGDHSEQFHDQIIRMAGNDLLAKLIDPVLGRLHWVMRQVEEPKLLLEDHRLLYEAISSGDPAKSAEISVEHVRASHRATVRLLFGSDN